MKELVICSGKGGTGKTSVTAAFAALAPDAVLADCDVDAADLHLVVRPEIVRREDFSSGNEAVIQPDLCAGCGTCLDVCHFAAVLSEPAAGDSAGFRIDPVACEGCGVCVHFCPEEAIAFPERVYGESFYSQTPHGPFSHARLGIGAENSGKLVTLVRTRARRLAEECGSELVLVDGPPGIGCPVIASLTGADLVLVVTEPTVSGLHDLERVVELARHFDLPVAVCLNKADINPDLAGRLVDYAADRGLPVVGRIPYDAQVTRAQLAGTSIVERDSSPAAGAMRETWQRVQALLSA